MRICVFCGSSTGRGDGYLAVAREVGGLLAERGIGLVYGGARVGMMGALADAALAGGSEVVGVIPTALMAREVAHHGLSELQEVADMHERKAAMAEHSDAFLALPGGIGTMEELFEVWTWAQIGIHRKPIGLLNVGGFYTDLIRFADHLVAEGFVGRDYAEVLRIESDPQRLLDRLGAQRPVTLRQQVTRSEQR
ncbi:MAG: TIGR00730 family Rossman fold protein [Sciscionella sp.]